MTSTMRASVAIFSAASSAMTVMMLSSPQRSSILAIVQFVVPEAVPDPPLLFDHVTLATPILSDASPARVIKSSLVL